MREIKFRLRLKELTKRGYRERFEYYTIGELIAGEAITTASIIAIDEYTGDKDKNDKEIYERDIVKIECEEVEFDCSVVEDVSFFDGQNSRIYAVVGNVYENFELLK